jgi:tetratricopeptide (TPR) repeat protein
MATGGALPEGHPPVERPTLPDDVKQFIATLVEEAERTPGSVEAWTKLAEVQYRAARIDPSYYEAALNSYGHLQEIEPGNADALRGLANVRYDKQQYVSARPYFEQYLELRPDDHAAQTDLATVRMHLGEVDEAIAGYREIIAANPTFVQAHYNLGVALHRTGDDQGAIDAFRHAKEITTDDSVRARIDVIMGQLGGVQQNMPATAGAARGTAPAVASATRTPFQESVETFFTTHQIVGPKLVAVEWAAPTDATVKVRDFPMTAMPPFAREKFTSRVRAALGEAKEAGGVSGAVSVAITDDATGTVMETVQE